MPDDRLVEPYRWTSPALRPSATSAPARRSRAAGTAPPSTAASSRPPAPSRATSAASPTSSSCRSSSARTTSASCRSARARSSGTRSASTSAPRRRRRRRCLDLGHDRHADLLRLHRAGRRDDGRALGPRVPLRRRAAAATPSCTASGSACSSPACPSSAPSSAWARARSRSAPRPARSGCCASPTSSARGCSRARPPTPSTSRSRRRRCSGARPPSSGSRSSSAPASPAPACRRCARGCSSAFGAKVYDLLGGAHGVMCCSCDAEPYAGMHVLGEDCAITTQLVDQETKAPIPLVEGAIGERVKTSLRWEAQPQLRASVGDVYQVHTDPCSCGVPGPRDPRPRPHRRPAHRQGRQDLPGRGQERRPGAPAPDDRDLPDRARRPSAPGRAAAPDLGRARRGRRRGRRRQARGRSSRRSSTSG